MRIRIRLRDRTSHAMKPKPLSAGTVPRRLWVTEAVTNSGHYHILAVLLIQVSFSIYL